jgi:hypothetical protein
VQTDRTVANNKPNIIIRDDEKGTCVLIDVAISGDGNLKKREAKKVLKYEDLAKKIRMWNVKNKSDTSNNRGSWNHLKIIQKIPEQHTEKAQN